MEPGKTPGGDTRNFDLSNNGIVCPKSSLGTDVFASLSLFFTCRQRPCNSLKCRRKGTYPVSKNWFTVPEFRCELELARGPNRSQLKKKGNRQYNEIIGGEGGSRTARWFLPSVTVPQYQATIRSALLRPT
jgi:hypothetical protein